MKTWNADILYKTSLILGEGALWHPQWKKFLYVDIVGQKVGCIDPVTKEAEERNVGKKVGTVVPAKNGSLIIALQGSIEELNFETGEQKKLIEIETDKPSNRSNDGKCDVAGRLWLGTMHLEARLHEGALYCYDGMLQKKVDNRSISNGICWTADSKTMYYIDTFDYCIRAYDFDITTGNIVNERIVVIISDRNLCPDGMTIDTEGMLWVAMWGGACVHRYNPASGRLMGKVNVGAPHVASCAFGGENMQQLFITTARDGLNEEQLKQYPDSGSLFIVNTDCTGLPVNYFKSMNS